MSSGHDLEVDTAWIRRSAATLEEAGHSWAHAAPDPGPALGSGALGDGPSFAAAVRLIASRCAQARQAADQLSAVAAGMSRKLDLCADSFDRLETGFRWPR